MALNKELRTILDLEEDGRTRLEQAERDAERLRGKYAEEAGKLEEKSRAWREMERARVLAEAEAEIAGAIATRQRRLRGDLDRIKATSEERTPDTLKRILAWLWEGG